MSVRNTVRAMPAMLRVGFSEAIAYRAEMLVWVLATTMPLIMMALWTAVARDEPVVTQAGRAMGQNDFIAYFLATFIVRQLTSSWAAWEMNFEVRQGTLSMRLLRPIHPLLAYASQNVAFMPMRMVIAIPVALIALATAGSAMLPRDWLLWGLWLLAVTGGWLITFLMNCAIGCLSLFMQSSLKVMDVYLAVFFIFSGYLFPIEVMPGWLSAIADVLPFRYQIGFPVELMTGHHGRLEALSLLVRQWLFVGGLFAAVTVLWNRGLKRFGAFGG